MATANETHIGDGVYASFENAMVKLRTERDGTEHIIYLEIQVFEALVKFGKAGWEIEGDL